MGTMRSFDSSLECTKSFLQLAGKQSINPLSGDDVGDSSFPLTTPVSSDLFCLVVASGGMYTGRSLFGSVRSAENAL